MLSETPAELLVLGVFTGALLVIILGALFISYCVHLITHWSRHK